MTLSEALLSIDWKQPIHELQNKILSVVSDNGWDVGQINVCSIPKKVFLHLENTARAGWLAESNEVDVNHQVVFKYTDHELGFLENQFCKIKDKPILIEQLIGDYGGEHPYSAMTFFYYKTEEEAMSHLQQKIKKYAVDQLSATLLRISDQMDESDSDNLKL